MLSSRIRNVVLGLRSARIFVPKRSLAGSVDEREIAKFSSEAHRWWDPRGVAGPLHKMNPVRVAFMRAVIEKRLQSIEATKANRGHAVNAQGLRSKPLSGIDLVDVGCGGKSSDV